MESNQLTLNIWCAWVSDGGLPTSMAFQPLSEAKLCLALVAAGDVLGKIVATSNVS